MSRNYDHQPETFPSAAAAVADYDPDGDGWKANFPVERKAVESAVADYCNPAIELGMPCDCIQAYGYGEDLLANPHCQVCGGTGRPTRNTLATGLDALNDEIDRLASTAGDICTPAKTFLDLAWLHTENAVRQLTGKCSMACKRGRFCACCHRYDELKALAGWVRRSLLPLCCEGWSAVA